jgi:hypothetical protein
MINNTPGRGFKNYRRMEYDIVKNTNGKGAEPDRAAVEEKSLLNKDELLERIKSKKWTLCTTASAVSSTPITQKDYAGQIKLR